MDLLGCDLHADIEKACAKLCNSGQVLTGIAMHPELLRVLNQLSFSPMGCAASHLCYVPDDRSKLYYRVSLGRMEILLSVSAMSIEESETDEDNQMALYAILTREPQPFTTEGPSEEEEEGPPGVRS